MGYRRGGEMVDAGDLKSPGRYPMRVRFPPPALGVRLDRVGNQADHQIVSVLGYFSNRKSIRAQRYPVGYMWPLGPYPKRVTAGWQHRPLVPVRGEPQGYQQKVLSLLIDYARVKRGLRLEEDFDLSLLFQTQREGVSEGGDVRASHGRRVTEAIARRDLTVNRLAQAYHRAR